MTYEPGKSWQILQGDVRAVAKTLEANSFHACLCDPPYGYSFMGRKWDYSVPNAMVWNGIERVLLPGAYAMIFGGPRTFHRVAIAVEDGGFGIEDLLMFLHGSGFPKSTNVSKELDRVAGAARTVIGTRDTKVGNGGKGNNFLTENSRKRMVDVTRGTTTLAQRWDGYGTQLKPGYEPVILAQKYTDEIIARNVELYGVGGLNIDASRIGHNGGTTKGTFPCEIVDLGKGRWPANVILSHDERCTDDECVSDCPIAMLDKQSGNRLGNANKHLHARVDTGQIYGTYAERSIGGMGRGDSGGASRFYYTAKADRYQRDAGCEAMPLKQSIYGKGGEGLAGVSNSKNPMRNTHPTVKPIDLIRYLAKLILPPPGDTPRRILVPFSGSGSEMIGCIQAGWDEVVGIEREAEYIAFATARIKGGGVHSGLADKRMRRRSKA